MTRPFKFSEGEYYHVYNRGVDRRDVFHGEQYYQRFIDMLYLVNDKAGVHYRDSGSELRRRNRDEREKIVAIGAYCLMPNHFHLLLRETTEGGIAKFMQKLLTGYTMYYNKRQERTGPLFSGKFKAQHVADDTYLHYLYAYIHLNPIKLIDQHWRENGIKQRTQAKNFLAQYQYSSYLAYVSRGENDDPTLTKSQFPEYFDEQNQFEDLIEDFLDYTKNNPEV